MLQLVVLGHELGKHFSKLFDLRSQLEFFHEAIRVLFELLWLELLVSE